MVFNSDNKIFRQSIYEQKSVIDFIQMVVILLIGCFICALLLLLTIKVNWINKLNLILNLSLSLRLGIKCLDEDQAAQTWKKAMDEIRTDSKWTDCLNLRLSLELYQPVGPFVTSYRSGWFTNILNMVFTTKNLNPSKWSEEN